MSVSVPKHMQVLTTLNKFGETSNATVKACIVCFGGDGRDMMWKPHCCGQSTHFECAEIQMLKFGTAVCFSCEIPFYSKKPCDEEIESPWRWVEVDWATPPSTDAWNNVNDHSWTWFEVLDGCYIPYYERENE